MKLTSWRGKLYSIAEFVTMLAVLQLMWIGLTLLGLVVLGISPATVGLFTVMRKRLQGQEELRTLTREYWATYKKEFVNANKIGVILIAIGYFLVVNFKIVMTMGGMKGLLVLTILVMVTILYTVMVMNIFQVFAHYDLPFSRYFSTSLLLSISFPIQMIGSMLGIYLLYKVFLVIPGLMPLFGISIMVLFLTWMSSQIFKIKGEQEDFIKTDEVQVPS